jgi:hypothetical protein
MGGRVVANAVARQDSVITIDRSGHISDPVPERVEIRHGATVYFQRQGKGNFIGDPQTSNTNWDAGTCLDAAGAHRCESDSKLLEAGAPVRLRSASKTLVDASYDNMYSSDIGWIYYDKKRKTDSRAGKKQLWKIAKTSAAGNSPGAALHYGDCVTISNINWPKASLGVKGKWLQCVNDDPTVRVLRDNPTA